MDCTKKSWVQELVEFAREFVSHKRQLIVANVIRRRRRSLKEEVMVMVMAVIYHPKTQQLQTLR